MMRPMPMIDSSMMSAEPMDTMTSMPPRTPVDIALGLYAASTPIAWPPRSSARRSMTARPTTPNNLGNINDLVLDDNGDVAAVVLGVGGFLGLGEKQVAVDYTACSGPSPPTTPSASSSTPPRTS